MVLTDGRRVAYHRLLIATGAAPRRLAVAGSELSGIRYLRTLNDAATLADELRTKRRIVIVGGGLIGLEVAATASKIGAAVTLVEAAPILMARAVPPPISAIAAARHRAAGVDLRLGAGVVAFVGNRAVSGVRLSDGEVVPCEAVLVAVGVVPRVELAIAAGLPADNGITVDATLRTGDELIFAAGDVTSFPHDLFGARVRLEHWRNAEEQGQLAARNMLGHNERLASVPWFWSDQYELTIQAAGLHNFGTTSVARRLGDDALLIFQLDASGRLVAVSGIGPAGPTGRSVRVGQMMIERKMRPASALLADASVDMKILLKGETV